MRGEAGLDDMEVETSEVIAEEDAVEGADENPVDTSGIEGDWSKLWIFRLWLLISGRAASVGDMNPPMGMP